jgi:galactokinase
MVDPSAARREFASAFGGTPRLFRAPGRVNLIGEHTDYNEGFVLPMAIDRDTLVAAAARPDRSIVVRSLLIGETESVDLDAPPRPRRGTWLDYVEGVARSLEARGARLAGASLVVDSDVPLGAGLSSSAALEVSVGLALVSVSGEDADRVRIALAGQAAEHDYVGARVGIMDQLVSALARSGHALLIDCRSLDATPIPLRLPEHRVVVCDSRVEHELASSAYNERREQCERGVELLRAALPGIRSLRDVSASELERHERLLPDPVGRRCRHVVTENARTLAAAEALAAGDAAAVGELMVRSHESLRDDYEVSCRELDVLVDAALAVDGVAGARMTGGGFGGSTVNLVRADAVDAFSRSVSDVYVRETGKRPAVYVTDAAEGACELL